MSKPGIIYRGTIKDNQFTTDNELDPQTWLVHILDHGTLIDDSASEEFIEMTMAGEPIKPLTLNNDENKFSPIINTRCEILVHTDDTVNLNTFAGGDDNRWEVKVWLVNQYFFRGFLKVDDIQQDFMPDPNELLLVATDNLDTLKDIPLTDDNEETLTGYNRIIDYIANSLKKTGLELEIKVINNLREADTAPFEASDATFVTSPNQIGTYEGPAYFAAGKKIKIVGGSVSNLGSVFTISSTINSSPTITLNVVETPVTEIATNVVFADAEGHFYDHEYLEARTFEGEEVGVSHDCLTTLEKILGEHCRLFQHWGQWWIVSVDELDENDLFVATFDADGVYDINTGLVQTTYNKNIGIEETVFFINEDAIVKPTRPHKSIKETFDFDYPLEMICNIDFSRGDLIEDNTTYKTYELDSWTREYNFPSGGSVTGDAYIRRNFDEFDDELTRYAVIEPESSTNEGYIKSCAVLVHELDRFILSFDWAFSSNAAGSGAYTRQLGYVLLYGDDGTYWDMDEDGVWHQSNSSWSVNLQNIVQDVELSDDQTEFINFSVTSKSIPTTGSLYILLQSESISRYNVDVYYNNLRFDYKQFINDGFREVLGYYNKITGIESTSKVKREKQVYISDPSRRIVKGALHKYNGTAYELTEGFYKGNIFPNSTPDDIRKFQEWQAWWVWNQFRLCNREFDFTAQGIDSNALISTTPDPISLLHKYFITDTNQSTTGRHFMLLHHEADVYLGEWSGFLSEVYNESEGKDYGETVTTSNVTGRWRILTYNTGGGDQTAYYMDVAGVTPNGYYKKAGIPPYPATADLSTFTHVGAAVADLLADLGITYSNIVSFVYSGSDTIISATTTFITAEREFKYLYE